jgi:hypothetical protein
MSMPSLTFNELANGVTETRLTRSTVNLSVRSGGKNGQFFPALIILQLFQCPDYIASNSVGVSGPE